MRSYQFQDRAALRFLRPAGERTVPQIAGEAHTAADYNLAMRPFAAQPFASTSEYMRKLHGEFDSSLSSCLISSRNEAAVS